MTVTPFLGLPVSAGAIIGAAGAFTSVYAVFSRLDEVQAAESRAQVALWLKGVAATRLTKNWASSVVEMFETLFGPRHFTLRCMLASIALTTTILFCLYLPYFFENDFFHNEICFASGLCAPRSEYWTRPSLPEALFVFILVPAVIDYLFLYKTRLLFTRVLSNFASVIAIALLIVLDVVLTLAGYFAFIILFGVIGDLVTHHYAELSSLPMGGLIGDGVQWLTHWTGLKDLTPVQVIFLDTLLTSAWLWLYFVLSLAFRAIGSLPYGLTAIGHIIDLNDHPLRSVGFLVALAAALIVLILTL